MLRYIIRRVAMLFVTLFIVFMMLFITARFAQLERQELESFTDVLWLDKLRIAFQDFVPYLKNVVTSWDWGVDRGNNPVWPELMKRADLTLRLNALAFFFYFGFGIVFGTLSALFRGNIFDRVIHTAFLVASSIPPYIMIMVLIMVLGYYIPLFPRQEPYASHGLWLNLKGLVIPVLAVSIYPMVQITRLVRGEMLEAFYSDYLALLKTKGLNKRQIIFRHLLKDSVVPILPQIVPIMLYVLGSSFIVEVVYNINGVTDWLFRSMFRPASFGVYYVSITLPPMVLIGTFFTALILIIGLFIDIVYGLLDPRVTMGAKKNGFN
ncbi:MAG: ABC transporter permease [Bacillota bacterium]